MTYLASATPGAAHSPAALQLDKDRLLQSIFRLSTFLAAPSKVDQILEKMLDEVVESIGFHRGIIRLFDSARQNLVARAINNYSREEMNQIVSSININEYDCIVTAVAKTAKPIAVEVTATDPRITDIDRMLTKIYDRGSYFCAPLKIGEEVIGIIAAWFNEETKFCPEEINLFVTYANILSMMIHNIRLFEDNIEKIRMLTVLQDSVSQMNASYVLNNHILEILAEGALQIAGGEKVFVYIHDIEKKRCLVNDGGKVLIDDRMVYQGEIASTIIRTAIDANTVISRRKNSSRAAARPFFADYPSEIALPLRIGEKFRGALFLAKKTGDFAPEKIHVLDILVSNASNAYENAIMHSLLSIEANSLKTEVKKLKEREDILLGFHNIIGKSEKMQELFHVIKEVAGHDTNILIHGESGTGKELIARAIHRQSNRIAKSFVDVNCAAIPGALLESEIFGYEAGAFTDARKRKIGLIEYANGGTMLLDEIGEMDIRIQAKFLRMLEDRHIRRLGGNESIPIDVRFVFSTNRDLKRMVAEGTFREDLFYRISVVPIQIPPLRERKEDLLLLARYYVEEFNVKFKKRVRGFSEEAERIFVLYSWPGNVRELRNVIERIMILHDDGDLISYDNLPAEIKKSANQEKINVRIEGIVAELSGEGVDFTAVVDRATNEIKKRIIDGAVKACGGNRSRAAKRLGISRFKLIREEKKIGNLIE